MSVVSSAHALNSAKGSEQMRDLAEKIDYLIKKEDLPWDRRGGTVVVSLYPGARKQHVWFSRRGEVYVFLSIIAGREVVARNQRRKRELARSVWRKNALNEIVTFAFDDQDRLIGVVEQPVATIDHEEVRGYIEALARECDRFEYALTGEDAG